MPWIPTEERLPETDGKFTTFKVKGMIGSMVRKEEEWVNGFKKRFIPKDWRTITHWWED